jgi:glycosyltransferase involved in cell wall biosynthesis
MTHPVQYAAPWFRHIAEHCPAIDLTVLYATAPTPQQQGVGFGHAFTWDVPLTDGYAHRVLRAARAHDDLHSDRFWGVDAPEVSAAIAATAPDVVLVPGWHSVTLVRALWACRRHGVPVLYRGDSNLLAAPRGWRRALWAARTRALLRLFDGYLSVGQRARDYLLRFGVPAARIFDVPHCVDTERIASGAAPYQTPHARQQLRARLGLRAEDFAVLFAGKLEDKKRPLDVIRAVATAGGDAALLVAGGGRLEAACRREAQRLGVRVVWLGFLNQSELPTAYAAADCLVLPSDARETWGLVVNEALATGLPCIVSDHVGCGADLVRAGQTGEIFSTGNVDELAAALRRIRQRAASGHDFGPACRAVAAQHSFARAAAGLLAACRAVTAPRIMACCSGMVVVSGLERSTFEVLRVARERGAMVHCIVNGWENQRIVALAEAIGASWSTAYHRYPFARHTRNPLQWAQAMWDVAMTSAGLLRDARRMRSTHVLLPELHAVLRNLPALAWLRARGTRIILRLGNAPAVSPFYRRVWRWGIVPFVDRVVCNSAYAAAEATAVGVPAAKTALVLGALPAQSVPVQNGGPRDARKVIFVGQVIPEKGVDLLLDAVALLAARGRDVVLDVVGQMNGWVAPTYRGYRERLLARAAQADLRGRVRFVGWSDDVPALLAGAGVHCCPSRPQMLEGLPLVALEAKQAGIPTVAFPVGPFPEIITHGVDGWICSEVSADALAEGLDTFLTAPDRQARAGEAARQSLQRFGRGRFSDEWWALFQGSRGESA